MPLAAQHEERNTQKQQAPDLAKAKPESALPKHQLDALVGAGPDAKGLLGILRRAPELNGPSLDWIESNLGLGTRAKMEAELAGGAPEQDAKYTVRAGDSLGAIARSVLGDPARWRELFELNRDVIGTNPNLIKVGQELKLPPSTGGAGGAAKQAKPTTQQQPEQGQDSAGGAQASAAVGQTTTEVKSAKTDDAQAKTTDKGADPAGSAKGQEQEKKSSVRTQLSSFSARVAAQAKAGLAKQPEQQAAQTKKDAGAQGKDRFEQKGPLGPRDRLLASHTDPLLGQFQVVLGLDGDISANAHQKFLTISSASGLLIRTPAGMSDLLIRRVTLNLETLDVNIVSEPEIGPMERSIITEVLRETLLANAPELAEEGKSPVAKAMEGLPTNADGKHIAWEAKDPIFGKPVIQLLFSPETMAGVKFNPKSLDLTLFPGLEVQMPGPDLTVDSLRYDFATATFRMHQQGSTTVLGVIGDQFRQRLLDGVAFLGSTYFKTKLPEAMRVAGYDPTRDPKFAENLDELYVNFTGVSMSGKGADGKSAQGKQGQQPQGAAKQGPGTKPQTGGPEADADAAERDKAQVLYRLESEKYGTIDVCHDANDAVRIHKDAKQVGIDSNNGIFMRVPGHDWVEDMRLKSIRYDLASGELDIEGTPRLGEFVRSIAEDLINAYVLPQLPGAAADGLGVGGLAKDATHQTLYTIAIPGAGPAQVLLERDDSLEITKTAEAIELSARQGIIIKTDALPSISELRIQRMHYTLATGEITIDSDRDIGPAVEKIASQLVRQIVIPQLPGGLEGLGLAGPEGGAAGKKQIDPRKLQQYSQVVYALELPAIGKLEARLAGGDTLGVSANEESVKVFGTKGILVVAPEIGLELNVTSIGINHINGRVSVDASEKLGAFELDVLSGLAEKFVLPMLEEHYKRPAQDPSSGLSKLYTYDEGGTKIDVCLEKGDALQVTKTDKAVELTSGRGILLMSPEGGVLPPNTRLERLHVDLQTGEVVIDSTPDVGAFGESLATKLVRGLVFPHLPPGLEMIGIQAPKQDAKEGDGAQGEKQQSVPEPDSMVLYENTLAGVGAFDVSIDSASNMKVSATAKTLDVRSASGLLVRIPDLEVAVRVLGVSIELAGGDVQVDASTPLGAFEQQVVSNLFRTHGKPIVSKYIQDPTENSENPDFDVLYEFTDPKIGAFSVCVDKGGSVNVEKTDKAVTLHSASGIFVTGLDWLPKFRLHTISYELGTGHFSIDVGGIAEGHYREGQDVGAVTEDIIGNIVKAVLVPHLPPEAAKLGVVGFDDAKADQDGASKGTRLFTKELSGLGELAIYLEKGDSLAISASQKEAIISSTRGLLIDVPDLRTSARVHTIKYHFETGEVQVDGLGQLENALIQGAIGEFVKPMLSGPMQGDNPIAAMLDGKPQDGKGRKQVVTTDKVDLYLMPNTRFDVGIDGGGLSFKSSPAMRVDGPSAFNYEFNALHFSFRKGLFEIDMRGDNVLASIFSGVARNKAEKTLNEMLLPLLPPEMLHGDYDLTADRDLASKFAIIARNFASVRAQS